MEKRNYVVGVDVGTSNVVMAIGSRESDGRMNIIGVASRPVGAGGVRGGTIENVQMVGKAIAEAKSELEETLKIRIDEAYAGIGGEGIRCAMCTESVAVKDAGKCISSSTVRTLFNRIGDIPAAESYEILDRIPQRFTVYDGQGRASDVPNPEGAFGNRLSVTMMFVLCKKAQIERVKMSFHNAGLRYMGVFANVAVTPDALLSPDEREEGAAVVDIGSGTTDIAVVRGGRLAYVSSLPIGASSINDDMVAFGIARSNVEKIKRFYGSAYADDVDESLVVSVQCARQNRNIPAKNLAAIIEARMKDIIDYVASELRVAKAVDSVPAGIVLTGGSARVKDIEKLFAHEMQRPIRQARAYEGLTDESRENMSLADTAAVAVVLRGASLEPCAVMDLDSPQSAKVLHQPAAAPAQPAKATTVQQTPQPPHQTHQTPIGKGRAGQVTSLDELLRQHSHPSVPAQPHAEEPAQTGQAHPAVPVAEPVEQTVQEHVPAHEENEEEEVRRKLEAARIRREQLQQEEDERERRIREKGGNDGSGGFWKKISGVFDSMLGNNDDEYL